jgi:hypothetical protein
MEDFPAWSLDWQNMLKEILPGYWQDLMNGQFLGIVAEPVTGLSKQ